MFSEKLFVPFILFLLLSTKTQVEVQYGVLCFETYVHQQYDILEV